MADIKSLDDLKSAVGTAAPVAEAAAGTEDTDDTTRPALAGSVGGAQLVSEAYIANTFYRDATAYFNGTTGNSTAIRTVSLYSSAQYAGSWQCWAFLFDHAQTKADGYGLTLRFRRAIIRTLVNP